jgi:hypothetical protein
MRAWHASSDARMCLGCLTWAFLESWETLPVGLVMTVKYPLVSVLSDQRDPSGKAGLGSDP